MQQQLLRRPRTRAARRGFIGPTSEGGGVGSVNAQTRKAESEGGGVGSVNAQTRKAESEGGGVGSVNAQTRKAESEGGGVGSVNAQTRKAEAMVDMPCVPKVAGSARETAQATLNCSGCDYALGAPTTLIERQQWEPRGLRIPGGPRAAS